MGVITGASKNSFVSCEEIYSKIRRELRSYSASNLIDEGDFPVYTGEVLEFLGISSMKECEAIIEIEKHQASLPADFVELYAAYKCDVNPKSELWRPQGKTTIRQDITCEILGVKNNCSIDCCYDETILKKVTTQMFINDQVHCLDYTIDCLLSLSPNVKAPCAEECLNKIYSSDREITINDGLITANFDGSIYMKYYGFPLDIDGLPMIPDNIFIKKVVEKYIKYQLLLSWWYNSDVGDIQNKWQKAEQEYNLAFAEAKYYLKLPAFSTLLNEARNKRNNNLVTFFSRQYRR